MLLYEEISKKINRTIMIEDENGKPLPALDVFKMSIHFLSEDCLKACNKSLTGEKIEKQDIHWVLTVPALWNDGAKQFMREAAVKAGIENRTLTIALEPEAASIYCRNQKIATSKNETLGKDVSCLEEGKRYMVIDAGGGTVDITVHQVSTNGSIKQLHASCGGSWGGSAVDKEFETVLLDVLGIETFEKFKNEYMEDYLEFWRQFEIKKRSISPSHQRPTRINLPLSLIETFNVVTHEDFGKAITKSQYAEDIKLQKDKLSVSATMMKSFFTKSINNIIQLVKPIIECKQITIILMVGGYSHCTVLQDAVKSKFSDIDVIVPEKAIISIVKGAVIFGYRPTTISKRVLKYTYGVEACVDFIKGKHPESKYLQTDAGGKCAGIFDKHVEKDEEVNVGELQVREVYTPSFKTQKQMNISVYASKKANPEYTDQDCHYVGKMTVDLADDGSLDREVEVALSFSSTEILIEAYDIKADKKTHAAIDFLD